MGRKPTEEETITLLQTTIVPQFDVEDFSLEEMVVQLNQLARDRNIPAKELTFSMDRRITNLRIRELRLRNVPLLIIPKYVCGNSNVRWWVDPGKVTFGLYDDFGPETDITGKKQTGPDIDPFADPVPTDEKPDDPDDPFFPSDPFPE